MSLGTSVAEKLLMISSDGHVTARMEDWGPYLAPGVRDEFDSFLKVYREKGSRNNEPKAMRSRFDADVVDAWEAEVIDSNRLEGTWDLDARLRELGRAGIAAEVLFPDFGLPFELYSPTLEALHNYSRSWQQRDAANRAYNRWLVDFCSGAPDRFAGLAAVLFDDVNAAVQEIRWAKEHGLRGVLLPMFDEAYPIFHSKYDPIWSTLDELEMPVNSHIAISGATQRTLAVPPIPHPSLAAPLYAAELFFYCQVLLSQLIWGGVLERHKGLQVVFTEQGSAWPIAMLEGMDYSWDGSYMQRDVRDVVPEKPSSYFKRQCHLGSSIFSRAEMEARHLIGVDKITLGVDYPHPEGTWAMGPGHVEYLRATVGAAHVPPDELRLMVGENAVKLWGFNREVLAPIVAEIGPPVEDVLQVPECDFYPRGDVHKPLSQAR